MANTKPSRRQAVRWVVGAFAVLGWVAPASAQLDPLLFVKRTKPNVLLVVDTGNRMQRDANEDYYDPNTYTLKGTTWEATLGIVAGVNTGTKYRRKYIGLAHTDTSITADRFTGTSIAISGDLQADFADFWDKTRLAVARKALGQAVNENSSAARFGLIRMRQSSPVWGEEADEGPVQVSDPFQQTPTDRGSSTGRWNITRPEVAAVNGSIAAVQPPLVAPDAANANTTILTYLSKGPGLTPALIPAGRDAKNILDAPVKYMLDDAKAEASRLIGADKSCGNTIVVLVVAGREGTTASGSPDPAATASTFLTVSSRRVPIYVVAIAPPAADVIGLQDIAKNSGGQYFEITKAMIDAAGTGAVPEFVRAVNLAVQHAFAEFADFNTAPTAPLPYGPQSEFQVTSPIVGTVNLAGATDINGAALPLTSITNPSSGAAIPQRSNLIVTAGLALPNFEGRLRGFRVYKPVADSSKPAGYRFVSDGTRLWVACAPGTTATGPCSTLSSDVRNIYTVLPDGSVTAVTTANASVLATYMNTTSSDAGIIISYLRSQPIGAIVGSTPAIMDPPSIDPPPDPDYPGFREANKGRRSVVWVGANDGMLHAIDARLGVEVYAFIPSNLLPKLKTLRDGQSVGSFDYFVDSSPKVADVKVSAPCPVAVTSCWRTYLIIGEGPGGTFYQTLDVTMSDMATAVTDTDGDINNVLGYFASPARITFKWSFPSYANFDYAYSTASVPYGDLKATATPLEKTVGQTWSDPAVGQIENSSGKYAIIVGSGFFPYSLQGLAHRGGYVAGTTLYLLNPETGAVYDSTAVTTDGLAETVDDCAAATVNDCTKIKNALQADPVATGPPDSRYITKIYLGDLDGRVWRFDVGTNDASSFPFIKQKPPLQLYSATARHPIFSSMATVNVGSTQQYIFFGTGSDLLPSNGVAHQYKLVSVLDQGSSGTEKFALPLTQTDGLADDEKVTSFPAVAGDIVFFTTTSFKPAALCTAPDANLYALTFIGGPAYDNTGDNALTTADTPKIMTVTGERATAPFIVDQHLVFGAGGKTEFLGDPADYNNGVGQVGVRILSWREVR